jgi:hypothetical protein
MLEKSELWPFVPRQDCYEITLPRLLWNDVSLSSSVHLPTNCRVLFFCYKHILMNGLVHYFEDFKMIKHDVPGMSVVQALAHPTHIVWNALVKSDRDISK